MAKPLKISPLEGKRLQRKVRKNHIQFDKSIFYFGSFLSPFSSFKYYNQQTTTRGNGNVKSHDKEESKFNSTINLNSGANTLTPDEIMKSQSNKNTKATIKIKENYNIGLNITFLFKNGLPLLISSFAVQVKTLRSHVLQY